MRATWRRFGLFSEDTSYMVDIFILLLRWPFAQEELIQLYPLQLECDSNQQVPDTEEKAALYSLNVKMRHLCRQPGICVVLTINVASLLSHRRENVPSCMLCSLIPNQSTLSIYLSYVCDKHSLNLIMWIKGHSFVYNFIRKMALFYNFIILTLFSSLHDWFCSGFVIGSLPGGLNYSLAPCSSMLSFLLQFNKLQFSV